MKSVQLDSTLRLSGLIQLKANSDGIISLLDITRVILSVKETLC